MDNEVKLLWGLKRCVTATIRFITDTTSHAPQCRVCRCRCLKTKMCPWVELFNSDVVLVSPWLEPSLHHNDLQMLLSVSILYSVSHQHHQSLSANNWSQTGGRVGGGGAPSVSEVNPLPLPQQWSPSGILCRCDLDLIYKKKKDFLPSANRARPAQVQLLFVCDFWQRSNFRNTAREAQAQGRKARYYKFH